MTEFEYISEKERSEYRNLLLHPIRSFAPPPVSEIWHYTNADGLIGILKSRKIWATQVACLNDSLEKKYFSTLVHAVVKEQRQVNTVPMLDDMWRVADEGLSNADFSAEGHFVACFSEVEDDLGQWRGYGGGECGYAIGFDVYGIKKAITNRENTYILPMSYEYVQHKYFVDYVTDVGKKCFLRGMEMKHPDSEKFARELFDVFSTELDIYASLIKHPKFSGEKEHRIATWLQPGERKDLEFRQRRTLLARHLPIDLTIRLHGVDLLPLTRIYVGPGPSQPVSRVSVSELLAKYDYENITVEVSKIPYRVP